MAISIYIFVYELHVSMDKIMQLVISTSEKPCFISNMKMF